VSAQGSLSFAADSGYPMDIQATFEKAQLAKSEAIAAQATGQLRLTKTATEPALLSGTLRLPETRYEIIRQAAADVPVLSGVRFKPLSGPRHVTGNEPAPQPTSSLMQSLRLDLSIVAPEQLYVSGMGLDSEWKAHLKVAGTASVPVLSGQVDLVRGNLDFAGRRFDLSEGHIDFTGEDTIDPTLAITASEDIEDVTVTVDVGGRAYEPQITFSSTPSLPQDEIMSRILFGSSVANISALQAVQLASSLNALRATGGGLNPLGKLRSATGISRLQILSPDAATGRGTALSAGQYITKNVYIEVITDAQGFTATQMEIALKKWLSVLGGAGSSGTTNFSVRIKKSY
jgi:translocation and assembly module TamB